METTVWTFKLSVPFTEWVKIYDSEDVTSMHSSVGIKTLFRGVSKEDPSKVCAIHQAPVGVAQKLFEDILDKVQKIYDDYVIVSSHIDDYDRDGAMIEVECANGWNGWTWNLREEIRNRKQCLYDSIIVEGFVNDKGEKICIDNDLVHGWIFDFIK